MMTYTNINVVMTYRRRSAMENKKKFKMNILELNRSHYRTQSIDFRGFFKTLTNTLFTLQILLIEGIREGGKL